MRQQSRETPVECDVRSLLRIDCLRRVDPYLHFCLDSSLESLLPRVRARPSVRIAKSRFCTFTGQPADGRRQAGKVEAGGESR